jgi:phage/plasmid-like protein (TIGR03299 family)
MAAGVLIQDGKAAMMYFDEEPWHGLGTQLKKPATAEEAITAASLAWEVAKKPLYMADRDQWRQVRDRFAVVPVHRWGQQDCPVFGIVGRDYTPLQNWEAFAFFDDIVGKGAAIYHTAGALGEGERVWILAKLPGSITVAGNDITDKYLLLSNSHDGQSSVQIKFTPIRVVCQNTLTMALSKGPTIRVQHTRNVKERLRQAEQLLGIIRNRFNKIEQGFQAMVAVPLNRPALVGYLKLVFPDPQDEKNEPARERTARFRLWAEYFFNRGKGNSERGVKGTLWAAYNGITEFVDHTRNPKGRQTADQRLESVWFGEGYQIKVRAFEVARQLAAARMS